jgi:hypothetical protein
MEDIIEIEETYDSLNKYNHYLVLHLDGLHDDLRIKNYNYLYDNFIANNSKNLKFIMLKDGKNILFGTDIEEDIKIFEDYVSSNDDFIIIKNPSYIYECFNICYGIFEILKPHNKVVDVIRYFDVLKYGTKRIFRIFSGRTQHLDTQNHEMTYEANFGGEDYIIIRTGFTSKIDVKKLSAYLERYKYLPYFMLLKDKDVLIKNEDIFTVDSPRRIEEIETEELLEKLKYFIKEEINDGFIVFANDYNIRTVLHIFHMLKEMNYCTIKNFSDIVRIIQVKFKDYRKILYLRLDCEEI